MGDRLALPALVPCGRYIFWYHAAGFCHGNSVAAARGVCGSRRRPQGTQTSVNGSRRVLAWQARRCKSAREQTVEEEDKQARGVALVERAL